MASRHALRPAREIAEQYLRKGAKVYLEGRLQTRKWQDKDGNDRYTTEIVANEMQMLDGRLKAAPAVPAALSMTVETGAGPPVARRPASRGARPMTTGTRRAPRDHPAAP